MGPKLIVCAILISSFSCYQQEQEIEIEKYVDLAYCRDNEAPENWPFSALSSLSGPPFYGLNEFHLYRREPIEFPSYLQATRNYFDLRWSGARRIKNVAMVMEWIPSLGSLGSLPQRISKLDDAQEQALQKAFDLFDADSSKDLNQVELKHAIRNALGLRATTEQLDCVLKEFAHKCPGATNFDELRNFLLSSMFREEKSNRFYVILSLAEAETIRRRMHVRLHQPVLGMS